ncbi:MAG: CAP domain-containing protein [Pedobacter sp.]|nr:MAG: CAP domain-containing protein [Pedobacter sp.]
MKKIYSILSRFLLVFITIGVVSACEKDNTAPIEENNTTDPPTGTVETNLNASLMLQLVNAQRTKGCNCGTTAMPAVAPLSWNDQLAVAALNHSTDMYTNNFFSHTSSNGNTLGTRITAAGYKWSAVAENIAMGQKDEQAVVTAWFNSEGHCKNLMNASYKEIGAAKKGSYWTQDFAAPQR